jgi:hypothetical protein
MAADFFVKVAATPSTKQTSTIPRHKEVDDFLAKKICKDLGIPVKK